MTEQTAHLDTIDQPGRMDLAVDDDCVTVMSPDGHPRVHDAHYYRVDSASALRRLSEASAFLPKRWDSVERPWQHRSLLAALSTLPAGHGIFRLSFWQRREPAERDLRMRGFHEPHLMTRVKRTVVQRALKGWHFEEDDFLRGEADLLWSAHAAIESELPSFATVGVALREFEVWDSESGHWQPWYDARALRPDTTRLPAFGWCPIALSTRQGGAVLGYWKLLPAPRRAGHPSHWLLITLDELARGTLGSEDAAIGDAVRQLAEGPLGSFRPADFGVLTVHPTRERVWMEQFAVSWEEREGETWLSRQVRRLVDNASRVLCAQPHAFVDTEALFDLVRRSDLPAVKTEFSKATWMGCS